MAGPGIGSDPGADTRLTALRAVMAASILSTAVHYTDNTIALDRYPGPESIIRADVVITWLGLTAIGLVGYRLYRVGAYGRAHACLLAYSATGLTTLLHYAYGGASRLEAWRHVSISLDGLAGLAVLTFVAWSWRSLHRGSAARLAAS